MNKIIVHTNRYIYIIECEEYDKIYNKLTCFNGVYHTEYSGFTDLYEKDSCYNKFERLDIFNVEAMSVKNEIL